MKNPFKAIREFFGNMEALQSAIISEDCTILNSMSDKELASRMREMINIPEFYETAEGFSTMILCAIRFTNRVIHDEEWEDKKSS